MENAIRIEGLTVGFGARTVIDALSLDVRRNEILGLIGASGGGKTVLLRALLGLLPKRSGRIEILGLSREGATAREIGRRCGTLFQQGALFSSLTVLENLEFPMREYLGGSAALRRCLPESRPPASGLHTMTPRPWSSEIGISSYSASRACKV